VGRKMYEVKDKSIKELYNTCENIRERLIKVVSKNGGHLASNLGVVELTVALHHVFESPKDKILWDVGHQAYVHKILTGRDENISQIRKRGGICPFTNPKESIHDPYISGHAGNALSAAYGIAEVEKNSKVIVVLGDAALASGESLEALNNIGGASKNMIIIINDNEMSIGENVGALSKSLSNAMSTKFYNKLKIDVEYHLRKTRFGSAIANVIKRIENSVRYFLNPAAIFEGLGFNYRGPIDGHNLKKLISTFKSIDYIKEPVIVHIKTKKGKGFAPAEKNKEKFHGVAPFDIETGEVAKKNKVSYSKVFGDKIINLAKQNEDIIAISAAMVKGTGLGEFFEMYPKRSYDVGIAEEHAVTFAGGLAIKGKKPIIAIYSTFLQRSYDQMIHDIAILNLPVVFVLDRAGIVGEDGETHQGIFDLSYLSSIPNFTIIAPTNKIELQDALEFAVNKKEGPVAIRIPRANSYDKIKFDKMKYGKWNEVKKGENILIIAVGAMLEEVMDLDEELKKESIDATITAAAFVKPLDEQYLLDNYKKYTRIISIEENVLKGGFGSAVLEFFSDNKISKTIERIGIPDCFVPHGSREELMKELGLKGKALKERIVGRRD
jgi:1-deoxy-D-xylulose-5-phosphate synthase